MSSLSGRRVLVTRPQQENDRLQALLAAHDAQVVRFPVVAILPDAGGLARLDLALQQVETYDWIVFTSQNAVALFCERLGELGSAGSSRIRAKIAAIGPVTARALEENGLVADVVPQQFTGDAIPSVMGQLHGKRILVPRARGAREEMISQMAQQGATVDEILLYQAVTSLPEPTAWVELGKGVDYVSFTSASAVHGLFALLGIFAQPLLSGAVVACIGPVTAGALAGYGERAQVVASLHTAEGLVQAMAAYGQQKHEEK